MEWVGFIISVGIGFWLIFTGAVMIKLVLGFSGRFSVEAWIGLFVIALGLFALYLSYVYAPFSIVIS